MTHHVQRLLSSTVLLALMALPLSASADEMASQLRPLNPTYTSTSTVTGANNAYGQPNYYGQNNAYSSYTTSGYNQTPLQGQVSTIPNGTTMQVRLNQPMSSTTSRLGETVIGTVDHDILANHAVIVPAGSEVHGQITNIMPSRRMGRHGEITMRFYEIKTAAGTTIPIQGFVVTNDKTGRLKGDSYKMDVAKGVGTAAGGTAIGAVTGTAVGGVLGVAGTGAVMGTGIGAAAGIGYALARKGKDVLIPGGTRLSVKVDEDMGMTP